MSEKATLPCAFLMRNGVSYGQNTEDKCPMNIEPRAFVIYQNNIKKNASY
jgi:hypothetical protein